MIFARQIRELKAELAATQQALETVTREKLDLGYKLETAQGLLEVERARRIGFETIASERRAEMDRLIDQAASLRMDLTRIFTERVKSLDALNVKLMESKAPETPPDMGQFNPVEKVKMQLVNGVREAHRAMDQAIISKYYPGMAHFMNRHPMNEPVKPNAGDPAVVGASD